ncbi:hypothetical protein [Albibacillus kandeliae]|uniref:hypothetical protein n=1 Tax=Albibacillus kandeliae TaxID=2174228 RepID=UPI000D68B16F|nr:hypothetical protein [Albibacillus kandeliae]
MMMARSVRPARGAAPATPVGIRELLEWAFRTECARIEFDEIRESSGVTMREVGTEYILMRRGILGCQIDGGGRSDPHPDADIVASAVAALPEGHGGRQMALRIAELARIGAEPDWMPGATLACVPVSWAAQVKQGKLYAKTTSLGIGKYSYRGREREYDRRVCPVTYRNDAQQIGSARRAYLQWWGALLELRETFRVYGGLSSFSVTDEMPRQTPWKSNR